MTGPESGIAGIEPELHPGAARYYKGSRRRLIARAD